MRNDRLFERAVAAFLACALAFQPLSAAAAIVDAPSLVPTGLPSSAGGAALAPTVAPLGASALTPLAALNAAAAPINPSWLAAPAPAAAPAAALPALAAPSVAIAAAAAPAAEAAPTAARALDDVAHLSAALTGPGPLADGAKAAAGRSFDLNAVRPVAGADAVSGAESATSVTLAPSAARSAKWKAVPPQIGAAPRWQARAKSYAPKLMLAAGVGAAVWILHHLGVSPAASAAPLAMLAGTLGGAEWTPSPAALDDFMSLAAQAAPPGAVLGYDEAGRAGHVLELDGEKVQAVLGALLQRGDLGMRDNQVLVHYDFAARVQRAPALKTIEDEGDSAALEAVKRLNSGAPLDHAKGLVSAAAALGLYEKSERETGIRPIQLIQAQALRANLALENIGDLLRAHREGVSRLAESPFKTKRLAQVDEALAWLKNATFTAGRVPPMTRELQTSLLEVLQSINPAAESAEHLSLVTDAYVEAFDLIERYPADAPGTALAISDDAGAIAFVLLKKVMPGERIEEDVLRASAAQLGWDVPRAYDALTSLGRRGQILIRDNGAVLMTSLSYRSDEGDANAKQAREESLEAVRLLNTKNPLDHLRALTRLDHARFAYADLKRAGDAKGAWYAETNILFANGVLEAATDALRVLSAELSDSLSGERDQPYGGMSPEALQLALNDAQKSLAWLNGAYYSADRRFEMPRETAQTMAALLDLRVFREIVKGKIAGDLSIVHGVRLARDFLARNAQGPRLSSSGAYVEPDVSETPGGFRPLKSSEYKTLLKYGTDVTQKAVDGSLRPMIGRKAELRQMIKTLLRVEKNNPLVIGEKGVGKTAIVNGLAQLIASGAIPELRGKNVIKIDLNKVVAGASGRGEFEERMQGIIDEARKSEGRVILFIDEIHMIVGAGDAENSTDAAQVLKESLADGSLSLIGATTMDEFRRIEKDGALMRRFNPIKLLPPTKTEAEDILEGVKPIYEKKHAVTIALETVKAAVALAARYVTDRHLPDSALDLMDDASAEVELKASEAKQAGSDGATHEVTAEDIAKEISMRTGIPAGKLNEDKKSTLKNLPAEMKGQVIGQDEAVEAVAEAVQAGEMGYRDPKQPIASFVFLGPTGVGKTELARALAKIKFGSEKNMLRLDMSEYMEKHSVSRLISAPPGYVGHDEGGQLTESIRRNPYQVILLDEIEKAHKDVFDILLQVLEDGRLTDGQGRTVDFSNTIIIMTSNIGGSKSGDEKEKADDKKPAAEYGWRDGGDGFEYKQDGIGFLAKTLKRAKGGSSADRAGRYLEAFKKEYRPEFVNRVGEDRVIVFNEIAEKSKLNLILDLRLKALESQLQDKGLKVALTDAAREAVLTKALEQAEYGARPVKQIVDRQINQALKDAELEGRIQDGDRVIVDWDAAAGRYRADKAADSVR